jgi:predicted helicase
VTIPEYIIQLNKNLAHGDATEHTHRPALKTLLESSIKKIVVTNEPKRIACGAPDFSITKKAVPLGYIETKDVGTDLDEIEAGRGPHGEQFKRYIRALPNWILTDYLEFRWYVNGERRTTSAQLGTFDKKKNKIQTNPKGEAELAHLLEAFFTEPALTVETAEDLAQRMAGMTRIIRGLIVGTFDHGSPSDRKQLNEWISAFRQVLIPDLNEEQFADMFSQTLAYGLFAACIHNLDSGKPFTRESAAFSLPKTNPFLRKLFSEIAGVDMPDTFGWAVDDIVFLLNHANWGRVLKDFGKGKAKHDPVVHFYETFLAAYDPALRELRGVYYTPEPVVSYIVRSLDRLLKRDFDRKKGLADEKTLILDPAVGTATFLFSVIQQIHEGFKQKGAWDSYVSAHLLDRVFGFELLMAPYAVAHLKLGMELQETGYKFESEQRVGIYLTNTLEEAARKSEKLFAQWISDEANAAAEIKRNRPILVVLGNPPYSGHSANRSRDENDELTFIGELIETYKKVDGKPLKEKNSKWLQDDYVKFIRFAQWRIDRTGEGVLGFVTNHRYLSNPTFRGMRQSLMQSFGELYIYDLHGNSRSKQRAPDGSEDENVFDIQQGVSIILAIKKPHQKGLGKVFHGELWGLREEKYQALSKTEILTTKWDNLSPVSPDYVFTPGGETLRKEYYAGWLLSDAMPVNSIGIVTARDNLTIHFTEDEVWDTVQDLLSLPIEEARTKYELGEDSSDWTVRDAMDDLRKSGPVHTRITPILYRPFDVRYTYYTGKSGGFHCRPRNDVMAHMRAGPNVGLATSRNVETDEIEHFFCSRYVMGHHAVSLKEVNFLYPAHLYAEAEHKPNKPSLFTGTRDNFSPGFVEALSARLKRPLSISSGLPEGISAEDILGYAYAIFYCPSFREHYEDLIRLDFPRLPLTSDAELFSLLAAKGKELISLHVMDSAQLDNFVTDFPLKGTNRVEGIEYHRGKARVSINPQQFFSDVPPAIWDFTIGGYQVCSQWLEDRNGRKLSYQDIEHWQRVVVAITETMRLTREIDSLIPGWPLL